MGYKQPSVRTGYEQVIAHRTGDLFAKAATKPGTVVSANANGIIVEYDDGTKEGIEVGRRYGEAAGLTVPQFLISNVKEGDKFVNGDILTYNTGFFEKDILNPKNVVWKSGLLVTTVLLESNQTLEDASSISKRLANQLMTETTKIKTVLVNFNQNIVKPLGVNTEVNPETILCLIEDEVTSNSNLFDEASLNTLRLMGSQAPTAKVKGTIERVEVLYRGDKEDMSDSLRELVNASDREIAKRLKSQNKTPYTGSITEDLRIENEPLAMDTAAIRFYITANVAAGVGDGTF